MYAPFIARLNPALRELSPYSVEGGQEAAVKLNQNESPFDLPASLKEAILSEFATEAWNRYPDILPFKGMKAYADFLGIPESHVMMSNGSNEMLYTIFLATLSKGQKVLIPEPSFSLYHKLAVLLQADIVEVPMHEDLSFDTQAIIRQANEHDVPFIVLSTPNNPTSRSLSLEEVEAILQGTRAIVLVDEAYIEFSREESAVPLLDRYPNLIVLRTMSKALALAGMRIGFALAQPALMQEIAKPKIPFTSSRLAEITLRHVLENYHLVDEAVSFILRERARITKALARNDNIHLFESDTNFLIIRVPEAEALFRTLMQQGILVRNVSGYPLMQNCLRFNIGLEQENDLLLANIRETLS
ncbi:histidinol-phosphate transaminase [Prosthecochloris vibrioformis]|uniref:Histidinol-phosphate aminotransferase n=1 Tax=Prosthecochloris vibrioformis TaxID=1098 RepID=A0A5C4S1Q7_PROVB|nr:histidinol-phosphate transaminase [Prosthecochloris vibrioformis]TNJ37394.1 histidinol-phosphate transaminase [Prosthecochloris vibrioformis]